MTKSNGKPTEPDRLTELRSTLTGKRAKLAKHEADLETANGELAALEQASPELARRAFADEPGAVEEFKNSNAAKNRLRELVIVACEENIRTTRAEIAGLEAELAASERAAKVAARDAHLASREQAAQECITHLEAAGAALARAGVEHSAATDVSESLGERLRPEWRQWVRTIERVGSKVLMLDRRPHGLNLDYQQARQLVREQMAEAAPVAEQVAA